MKCSFCGKFIIGVNDLYGFVGNTYSCKKRKCKKRFKPFIFYGWFFNRGETPRIKVFYGECLDRYCNGPKVCERLVEGSTDEYMCEAEGWCEYHPKYKKDKNEKTI